jgi:uncharacterized phiE125 gp8 family phage protein
MMKILDTLPSVMQKVSGPASEPVSADEAKKHLEIVTTDHEDQVGDLIQAAREQWEHDTDSIVLTQTWKVVLDRLGEFRFAKTPAVSISGVQYYDTANQSQTLSSSVYQLDMGCNGIRLAADQDWPQVYDRWDAVTITATFGYASATGVPQIIKQAILLLVGHYFEDRGEPMSEALRNVKSYEALVRRFKRSSYP